MAISSLFFFLINENFFDFSSKKKLFDIRFIDFKSYARYGELQKLTESSEIRYVYV